MKPVIHKFKPSDLKLIDSEIAGGLQKECVKQWVKEDTVYSVWHDNRVIAIGGVITVHQGVGEAVLICEDNPNGDRFRIARASRNVMDYIFQNCSFHRLQARAPVENALYNRFIVFLGFKKEGVLESYGFNGEDYFIYARVKRWQQQP